MISPSASSVEVLFDGHDEGVRSEIPLLGERASVKKRFRQSEFS